MFVRYVWFQCTKGRTKVKDDKKNQSMRCLEHKQEKWQGQQQRTGSAGSAVTLYQVEHTNSYAHYAGDTVYTQQGSIVCNSIIIYKYTSC